MSEFVSSQQNIDIKLLESESDENKNKIIDIEESKKEKNIEDFSFSRIKKPGDGDYTFTKKNYGPLAATDPDRVVRTKKDSKFVLNPVVRAPLAVEDEEKKRISEMVEERIQAVREEVKKKAYDEGFSEGQKQGYDEAFKRYRSEGESRLKAISDFLNSTENAKAEIFKQNEKFVVEVIYAIAKSIILKEVEKDKSYVVRLVEELIERIGVRDNITVKVNPKDRESIQMLSKELESRMGELKNLKIVESEKVKNGGCIVESQWNAIDASVDTQLIGLRDSLIGTARTEARPNDEDKASSDKDSASKTKDESTDQKVADEVTGSDSVTHDEGAENVEDGSKKVRRED